MPRTIESICQTVRRRCDINLLLAKGGLVLAGVAALALAAVAVERLAGLRIINTTTVAIIATASGLLLTTLWLRDRPTLMAAALLIDRRLALAERFSTALALAGRDDPFARSAEAQTRRLAQSLSLTGRFPVRPTARWLATVGLWLLAGAAIMWLPRLDLFGVEQRQQAQRQQAKADAAMRQQVQSAFEPVKTAVQQLGQTNLDAELAKLDSLPADGRADELRRDAIGKLGQLDDTLKKLAAEGGVAQANALRQALAQLRSRSDAQGEMNRNLSDGRMAQAAKDARDLAEQLRRDDLSEEQRAQIHRELAELNKRLNELAGQDQQQAGDGAPGNQQARRAAAQALQELADQLERCAGESGQQLTAEELERLAEMLDELGQAQRLAELIDDAELAIEQAVAKIGQVADDCRQCGDGEDGDLCAGCTKGEAALALRLQRDPSSVAGHGTMKADSDYSGPGADRKVSAARPGQDDQAPPIASWLFRGEQARGEAGLALSGAVQAAKDRAAEAVTEQRIPRKYEAAVKAYFEKLQQD